MLKDLPPHIIFVAGQDPLRDEAIAYAQALEKADVKTKLHIYQGVPHNFAEFEDLTMTKNFHKDLSEGIKELLG